MKFSKEIDGKLVIIEEKHENCYDAWTKEGFEEYKEPATKTK